MVAAQAFDTYVRDTTAKLQRKVEDLEDVRNVMGILKEVRSARACSCCKLLLVCTMSHAESAQ